MRRLCRSQNTRPTGNLVLRLSAAAALVSGAWSLGPAASIHAQPTQSQTVQDEILDDEQVGKEFEEIFDGPDFRRLRSEKATPVEPQTPQWLEDFFNWLRDRTDQTGNALRGLGIVLQALAYSLLAAICAVIIWLVVRAVNKYRNQQTTGLGGRRGFDEGESDIPPGDLPADEYLRRASEMAARGLFREAIGQLILGAMSRIERSGLIRFRRGLTHRDYLRALRGRTEQHQAFRQIVGVYEPICFGRRPAQNDQYLTSLDGYRFGFQEPLHGQVESTAKGVS